MATVVSARKTLIKPIGWKMPSRFNQINKMYSVIKIYNRIYIQSNQINCRISI